MSPKVKSRVITGGFECVPSPRTGHDLARVEFDLGHHEIDQLGRKPRIVQDFSYQGALVITLRRSAYRQGADERVIHIIYPFALEPVFRPTFLAAYARLRDALSLAFCSGVHVRAVAVFGTPGDVVILLNATSAASIF